MKALVTGADGFIGSHLTELLLAQGYCVRALSYYNSFNDWGWLEGIPSNKNLEIVTGDIRDPNICRELVKNVDIIFHLAALIAIPYSYRAPDSYIDTNVKGTLNICQAARDSGNIRIIHTSTSEVYGTALYVPMDENHPKQPQSPYSASKIGADMIALSFYNAFGLPVTVARPFNTYGPRQSARAFIPTVITQILSGAKSIQLGDLTPTRDLNYVMDTCQGFLVLAGCESAIGKEVNISSNYEVSMKDTVEILCEILNCSSIEIVTDEQRIRPANSEVFRLWGDNSLIKALTGFTPKYSIREGLEKTCKWFALKENLTHYKTGIYNV